MRDTKGVQIWCFIVWKDADLKAGVGGGGVIWQQCFTPTASLSPPQSPTGLDIDQDDADRQHSSFNWFLDLYPPLCTFM